jgi:hypothetical protein
MQNYHQNHGSLDRSIMEWLADNSATIIVLATLGTFFLCGFLEFHYYLHSFGQGLSTEFAIAIAIALPFVIQGIRCATVSNSAKLFKEGKKVRGGFVILCSFATSVFCAYQMTTLATAWAGTDQTLENTLFLTLQFLVWAGFALEIILAVSVSGNESKHAYPTPLNSSIKQPIREEEEAFSKNGATYS